jgi:uncharacterized membrane protein YhaH (DUF805 family)
MNKNIWLFFRFIYIWKSLFFNINNMNSYPNLFDRIGTTFEYLFSKVWIIILVNFWFTAFFTVLIKAVFIIYAMYSSEFIWPETQFIDLFYRPELLYMILVWGIFLILYFLLIVFMVLWNVKSFQQVYHKEELTILDNFIFAKQNYFSLYKTYWYLFAYIALYPSLLFILWGILFWGNASLSTPLELFKWISIAIMLISVFWFIVNAIYRTYRSIFSLYHAVVNRDFTKENFLESLEFTKWKYWRVFWNMLLISIIFQIILMTSHFFLWFVYPSFISSEDIQASESFYDIVATFHANFQILPQILMDVVSTFLTTFLWVWVSVFTFLFYKDFQKEYEDELTENSDLELSWDIIQSRTKISQPSILKECFNREWRVNRQRYFFYTQSLFLIFIFTAFLLLSITTFIDIFLPYSVWKNIFIWYVVLFGGICAYINILFWIKRFRDFWQSWWYVLLLLIPIFWIFVSLVLFFFKWDVGPNKYGPDRLQEKPAQKLQPTEEQVL